MKLGQKLIITYIFIFFLTLLVPVIGIFIGITSKTDNTERRALAKFPHLNKLPLQQYPKAFDSFWNDNFGFRNWFLDMYTGVKEGIFKSPPTPWYDTRGKDGWLFINPVSPNDYVGFYKHIEFSETELEAVKNKFLAEKNWLKARNIDYMIVIVPDKDVIYPEYYPYPNHLLFNIGLEQFINYFKKNTDIDIVYLKNAIMNGKKSTILPLYYKTDTHWNNLGTFFGYQDVMKQVKKYYPNVDILNVDDFDITKVDSAGNSVGDLIRIDSHFIKSPEEKISMKLKDDSAKRIVKLSKVFMYGDSFSVNPNGSLLEGLNLFLRFNFNDVVESNYGYQLDFDEIEKAKPELVIRESVQRNIHDWVKLTDIK